MSLPAYVINLDRAPERLNHFQAQARAAGLVFERLSAIDARLMSPTECAAWENQSAIYPLTRSEIGCILSHQMAWSKIAASGNSWGAVFEDDVFLSPELNSILEKIDQVPENIDVIKLETFGNRSLLLDKNLSFLAGRALRQLRGLAIGSAGYLISSKACHRLLQAAHRPTVPVDLYLFSFWKGAYPDLNVHVLLPAPVIQSSNLNTASADSVFESLIADRGKAVSPRLPPAKRLQREWYRIKAQFRGFGAEPVIVDWR